MKITSISAQALLKERRLDARYFAAAAVKIRSSLANTAEVSLRRVGDYANVWAPGRFKRSYATPGEDYVSYLRPYDVFEFLPPEADRLSVRRTERLDEYRIRAGDLLQTCSGRNLGPLTIADAYLARFALSHDMVRVTIEDESDRYYTLGFLQSRYGQELLRGDLNGSVIDHITTDQVASIHIPFIGPIHQVVAQLMGEAVAMREQARIALHDCVEGFNVRYPRTPDRPYRQGWTVKAQDLGGRLDAAVHSGHIAAIRGQLEADGGVRLGDVADVVKPGGRQKLYYVGPGEGTPFLSGRQILQAEVIGAKNVALRSIDNESGYGLGEGWITFQADGRAEESLGYPSVVLEDRANWFASGHVGRAIPKNPEDTGWIWAAMASNVVQAQVEALACGSVVDALYVSDLVSVVLPPRHLVDASRAKGAWDQLSVSARSAGKAKLLVEETLHGFGI